MKPLTLRLISAFCLWSVFVFAELCLRRLTKGFRQILFCFIYCQIRSLWLSAASETPEQNIGCNVTLRLLLHSRPAPNSRVFPPDLVSHRGLSFCSLKELFRGGKKKKQYILPF